MTEEQKPEYEKTVYENIDKGYQLRIVLNEFRGTQYLHIRRYFLSYEGDWVASKEGVSMVASIQNIFSILDALIELCSNAEGAESILKYFQDKLQNLKNE